MPQDNQPFDIDAIEVQAANAGLGAGYAIVKLESTEMTAIARQNPRNHALVLKDIEAQLATYPAFAREAIYSKPVGKEFQVVCKCGYEYVAGKLDKTFPCPKCGLFQPSSSREVTKYARNLSIRASEAIFSSWGNCAASFVPLADTPDYAEFAAIFMDYERCTKMSFPVRVSKSYRTRAGQIIFHAPDRFSDVVLKAARSKALREVINRSIPPGLRAELFERADEILNGLLDEKTQIKLVAAFAEIGISQQQIEQNAGKQLLHFTQQDRKDLLGLYQGIKDGEITKDEAFPAEKTTELPAEGTFGFGGKAGPGPGPLPKEQHPATVDEITKSAAPVDTPVATVPMNAVEAGAPQADDDARARAQREAVVDELFGFGPPTAKTAETGPDMPGPGTPPPPPPPSSRRGR